MTEPRILLAERRVKILRIAPGALLPYFGPVGRRIELVSGSIPEDAVLAGVDLVGDDVAGPRDLRLLLASASYDPVPPDRVPPELDSPHVRIVEPGDDAPGSTLGPEQIKKAARPRSGKGQTSPAPLPDTEATT